MKKAVFVFYLILFLITNTGCWDIKNINRTAFVTGLGLDINEEDPEEKYKITFEIIRPAGFKEKLGPTSIIETITATSIHQGVNLLQAKISRPLSLTHTRVLVVGEKMAKIGFNDILNYVQKNPELTQRLRVIFAKDGEAVEILKAKPIFEKTISKEILTMAEHENEFALSKNMNFKNFATSLRFSNGRALSGKISLARDNTIISHGAAVFANWKLREWLDHMETRNANWLVGKDTHMIVDVKKDNNNIYTYKVTKRNTKIKPIVNNNQISFIVNINTDGTLIEEQGHQIDFSKVANIKELEKLCANVITKQVESALHKSQKELGVDYLGFGAVLHSYYPQLYERLNWEKFFPGIQVKINVKARINRFGLTK